MTQPEHCPPPCGGDPRTFTAFPALRDEMRKLTHPARPDIHWQYAESLCETLFEQNGVDLQTLAWYTLARANQAGVTGINQGLSLLETVVSRHWHRLWPQSLHARTEILRTLSRRLQQQLRSLLPHTDESDSLEQAERHLSEISRRLLQAGFTVQIGFEVLARQLQHAVISAEDRETHDPCPPTRSLAVTPLLPVAILPETQPLAAVPQQEIPLQGEPVAVRPTLKGFAWRPFGAGMACMLFLTVLLPWGYQRVTEQPEQQLVMATVPPLPEALTRQQATALKDQQLPDNRQWFTAARQQLSTLEQLPPTWLYRYAGQLVSQAYTLWPESPQTAALARQWQQQLAANTLPVETLNGWNHGMALLSQLTDKLNRLDGQKGKYLTVSELKSQVFAISRAFNQTIPTEESLRQLSQLEPKASQTVALRAEIELHLRKLLATYSRLTPPDADSLPMPSTQ